MYRRAIDDAVAGRPFNPELITELESLSNRGYTAGFLERRPAHDYQNYETGSSQALRSQYVAEVQSVQDGGWVEVETKNRFAVGDLLEVVQPGGNRKVRLEQMRSLDGEVLQVAAGSPLRVRLALAGAQPGALLARVFEAVAPASAAASATLTPGAASPA